MKYIDENQDEKEQGQHLASGCRATLPGMQQLAGLEGQQSGEVVDKNRAHQWTNQTPACAGLWAAEVWLRRWKRLHCVAHRARVVPERRLQHLSLLF